MADPKQLELIMRKIQAMARAKRNNEPPRAHWRKLDNSDNPAALTYNGRNSPSHDEQVNQAMLRAGEQDRISADGRVLQGVLDPESQSTKYIPEWSGYGGGPGPTQDDVYDSHLQPLPTNEGSLETTSMQGTAERYGGGPTIGPIEMGPVGMPEMGPQTQLEIGTPEMLPPEGSEERAKAIRQMLKNQGLLPDFDSTGIF